MTAQSLLVGLATEAKQDSSIASLASILAKLSADPATQATLAAVLAKLSADPASQTTLAAILAALQAALPLPTGAATSALQSTISGKLDALATEATQLLNNTLLTDMAAKDMVTGGSVSALGINALTGTSASFDAALYRSVSFHAVGSAGISAGAIFFEQSNDNVNWVALPVVRAESAASTPINAAATIAASSSTMWVGSLFARYVRARVSTAFVGGTVQVFSVFSNAIYSAGQVSVHQSTAASLLATVSQGTAASLQATVTPLTPTPHALSSAATTNLTSLKASAGTVFVIHAFNANAARRYLKLYNKASAPVLASDVPIMVITLEPGVDTIRALGELGKRFSTGIAYALTTGVADTDATAVAVAEIKLAIDYV